MSVQAPEPVHAAEADGSPRPERASETAHAYQASATTPPSLPDGSAADPGPVPRRRSRFGFLWLRLLILLLGMLLGAALLATFQATGTIPPTPVGDGAAELESDIVVSVRESYLNRQIAERAAAAGPVQNLQVELQPNRRLTFVGDVQVLNQRLRANANGSLGVSDGRVQVQVEEVRVGTLRLPADLGRVVAEPMNAELQRLAADDQFRIVDVATATDRIVIRLAAVPSQSGQGAPNR